MMKNKITILFICFLFTPAFADFSNTTPKNVKPLRLNNVPTSTETETETQAQTQTQKKSESGQPGSGLFGEDVANHDSQAPVSYKALKMVGVRGGVIELVGGVSISQDATSITADKAQVFPDPKTNKPVKAIARGNVKIKKKPTPQSPVLNAVAEEMEFFFDTKKAQLRGKPKIWRGKELIEGKVIDLDLVTGQAQIGAVSGVFDPEANKSSPIKKRK